MDKDFEQLEEFVDDTTVEASISADSFDNVEKYKGMWAKLANSMEKGISGFNKDDAHWK